jgi:hypothetical protein
MPVGNPFLGELLILEVEDPLTPGTFIPVSNMNDYSFNSGRPVRKERVFNKVQPLRVASTIREQGFTISGFTSIGDTGQGILNAAELAGTTVKVKCRFDGTNGMTVVCYVTSYKTDQKPDGGFAGISYDFEPAADPVAVGAGWTAL